MNHPTEPFSDSYAEARAKFVAAAGCLPLVSHFEPRCGFESAQLAVDVVVAGAENSRNVLLITSGCHGVEGYCGSGIQIDLLNDLAVLRRARLAGVTLVLVHALNPWGFSFGRRVTHEGVDLNRNFTQVREGPRRNAGYDAIADLLLPDEWPPEPENEQALMCYIADHGMAAFQQAVSSGQRHHPEGLFYSGEEPTWSHRTLRKILRQYAGQCARLGWIDLHTGLGGSGAAERIFAGRPDIDSRERAKAWWGEGVTFLTDGTSSSADVDGSIWQAVYDECPQAEYTGIALEFGTCSLLTVLQALRFDHWVARQRNPASKTIAAARLAMRDAFFVDTPEWKASVLLQARDAIDSAVRALARSA